MHFAAQEQAADSNADYIPYYIVVFGVVVLLLGIGSVVLVVRLCKGKISDGLVS